jgi:hypothetical protein
MPALAAAGSPKLLTMTRAFTLLLAVLLVGCTVAPRAKRPHAVKTRIDFEHDRDRARTQRLGGIIAGGAGLLMVTAGALFAVSAEDARMRPDGGDGDGLGQLAAAVVFFALGATITAGGAIVIGTSTRDIRRAERALEALDDNRRCGWRLCR